MLDRSIIEWSGPGADTAHDWWGSFTFPRIFQSSCALSGHPIINADKINFKISYNNVFSSADFHELENACTLYNVYSTGINFWRGAAFTCRNTCPAILICWYDYCNILAPI